MKLSHRTASISIIALFYIKLLKLKRSFILLNFNGQKKPQNVNKTFLSQLQLGDD